MADVTRLGGKTPPPPPENKAGRSGVLRDLFSYGQPVDVFEGGVSGAGIDDRVEGSGSATLYGEPPVLEPYRCAEIACQLNLMKKVIDELKDTVPPHELKVAVARRVNEITIQDAKRVVAANFRNQTPQA